MISAAETRKPAVMAMRAQERAGPESRERRRSGAEELVWFMPTILRHPRDRLHRDAVPLLAGDDASCGNAATFLVDGGISGACVTPV
jgi:hypothetical protein